MNAFFYIKDNEVSAMTIGDRIFERLSEIGEDRDLAEHDQ